MDRFPFLEWIQTYTLVKLLKDAQAGFVVATLVIPQVRIKEPKGHDDLAKCENSAGILILGDILTSGRV